MMLLLMGGVLLFSLLVFFVCEEKSLKDANFSDMKGLFTEELKYSECIGQFQTVKYMLIYFFVLLAFDLAIAILVFIPNGYGLQEALAYTFIPSLFGSFIILLVKWTYQPVIKVISSFMYGSAYMTAAIASFLITYFLIA